MNKIEELEKQAKSILEELEKLKKEEKVWKPKDDEKIFIVSGNGNVDSFHFCEKYNWYKEYLEMGNYFKMQEEAAKVAEKAKIYTQLKRLAEEINTEPIDWENDGQNKFRIIYNSFSKKNMTTSTYYLQEIGQIYSTNKDFLEIAKERIGEENLLKLFKE